MVPMQFIQAHKHEARAPILRFITIAVWLYVAFLVIADYAEYERLVVHTYAAILSILVHVGCSLHSRQVVLDIVQIDWFMQFTILLLLRVEKVYVKKLAPGNSLIFWPATLCKALSIAT